MWQVDQGSRGAGLSARGSHSCTQSIAPVGRKHAGHVEMRNLQIRCLAPPSLKIQAVKNSALANLTAKILCAVLFV